MYSIELTETSKKFLKKLEKRKAEIILNKIYSIRDNPFRFLKKLQGQKLWRLRIDNFRAVMDILISQNKIIVLRIGYRRNIYD